MTIKHYIVGGAVRDKLLDIPTHDRDWVTVGATPEQMLDAGFKPVGKDFPVFLHPTTKEEYALARTERKKGRGYHGFTFYSAADVTLEDDLKRRDITINAMAQDANDNNSDNIIDPYGGKQDLDKKIIRHTSDAFVEDPLRVLRVARFAAKFHNMGFTIADETTKMLKLMVQELDTMSAERIWVESSKALECAAPQVFFEVLHEVGGLNHWYPEVEKLFGIPQPPKYHPEIDCGIHTLAVLKQAALLSEKVSVRFAALTHDLGKGTTPKDVLPSHRGHEGRGVPLVKQLCERITAPREVTDFAVLCCRYHTHAHRCKEMLPDTMLKVFDSFDLWRRPHRFADFLLLCKADSRGRLGFEDADYTRGDLFAKIAQAAKETNILAAIKDVPQENIYIAVRQARLDKLKEYKKIIDNFTETINLGIVKFRREDYEGSLDDFNKAIKIDLQNYEAYYYRALLKYELKEYQNAIDDFTEVIKINQNHAAAYNYRGNAKLALGHKGSDNDFAKAIDIDPNKALVNPLKDKILSNEEE